MSAGYDQGLPFHNFHHGVAVLQGCYAMLMQSEELASALTPMDRLALCAACLGLWGVGLGAGLSMCGGCNPVYPPCTPGPTGCNTTCTPGCHTMRPPMRPPMRPHMRVSCRVRLRCVAALGHDLGHTGTSNAFLVNSRDELALLYNDVAVRYSSMRVREHVTTRMS